MDITVKNLQSKIPIPVFKIKSLVRKVVDDLHRRDLWKGLKEVSFVFVGSKRMRSINKDFLGHDYVTDVLTFDLGSMAEIIICPSTARMNAKTHGALLEHEILLYVVHGLLHLAGYDDHSATDIERMRLKEQQLLKKFL